MDSKQQLAPVARRGRPKGSYNKMPQINLAERLQRLASNGGLRDTARRVLDAIHAEETWVRLITNLEREKEYHALIETMKFLTSMRDGRPAQQININSRTITISADTIAHARSVVQSLRYDIESETTTPLLPDGNGDGALTTSVGESMTDVIAPPNVVGEQGGKSDGHGG